MTCAALICILDFSFLTLVNCRWVIAQWLRFAERIDAGELLSPGEARSYTVYSCAADTVQPILVAHAERENVRKVEEIRRWKEEERRQTERGGSFTKLPLIPPPLCRIPTPTINQVIEHGAAPWSWIPDASRVSVVEHQGADSDFRDALRLRSVRLDALEGHDSQGFVHSSFLELRKYLMLSSEDY